MLPPGHVAAGYLVANLVIKLSGFKPGLLEANHLVLWGMFFSFAPDLDTFYSFAKEKAFTVHDPEAHNHRKYWSHAPLLWLFAGLAIYLLGTSEYVKCFGLLVWMCSWSHFVLDSIEYGIMWLWPFSKKIYAIRTVELMKISEPDFLSYWLKFLKVYRKYVTFYLEIAVIISAIIYFKLINF